MSAAHLRAASVPSAEYRASCTNKMSFQDRKTAELYLHDARHAQKQKSRRVNAFASGRTYQCPKCGAWHLTKCAP